MKNQKSMEELETDSKLILASIYAVPGEGIKSFADQLKELSSETEGQQGQAGSEGVDNLEGKIETLKSSLQAYLELLKFNKTIFAEDEYATVITNAAILERFKIEAIEILAKSQNLTKSEEKTKVLNSLFGPETEYGKIYDEYYKKEGSVARAQEELAKFNIEGILDSVIPETFKAGDFDITKDTNDVFKLIDELKKVLVLTESKKSFRVATEAFDEENIELTMFSLLNSDPKKLGALFAIMGDKDNGGQIEFKEHKLTSHENTYKAYRTSARRLLVIAACLVCGVVSAAAFGALVVPSIAAFASVTVIGAAVGLVACSALSLVLYGHITSTVKKEAEWTQNEEKTFFQRNIGGTGISNNDAWNYFIAPIRKGEFEDIEKSLEGRQFEKKLLDMQKTHLQNEQKYFTNKTKIQSIVPNSKNIMKARLGISHKNSTALTVS